MRPVGFVRGAHLAAVGEAGDVDRIAPPPAGSIGAHKGEQVGVAQLRLPPASAGIGDERGTG